MAKSMLRNNFKARLIVPVALALLLMSFTAVIFIVVMQRSNNVALNTEIKQSFTEVSANIKKDLLGLSSNMENDLNGMRQSISSSLEKATSESLQKTGASVQENLQLLREQSGQNVLQLLSLMATNAVIAKDFASLNSYVRSAHNNPELVFIFYRDKEQKPLTRYLHRKNEKLKSYLPEKGRPDIDKIIESADADPNVLVLKQDILSEGDKIGSVTLAIDMTQAITQASAMNRQFDDLVANNGERVNVILDEEAKAINQDLQKAIADAQQTIDANGEKTVTDVTAVSENLSRRVRNFFTLGSIAGLLLVLSILMLNARSILRLLGGEPAKMVDLAQQIAKGNLTQKNTQPSIAGSLQAALQEMSENLRHLIGEIVRDSRSLNITSNELAIAAEDMTGGAEQSATKANTVAAATEEMSANMGSVTMASEQAAQNVNIVATAMEEMTAAVREIAGNTEKARTMTRDAVTYAKSSSDKVNNLGSAANEISKITEVITEISEQTNLLALNATIEAARAGEAGKGFAVVANEIKELAKQTAEATYEIKSKIDSIQSSTDDTVKEITEISSVINSVNEIVSTIAAAVEQQSATAGDISENVNEAANGISEVNENVSQASSVAGEIARDIADVSQVSQEARMGSQRLQESSERLKEIAKSITQETAHFNIGDGSPQVPSKKGSVPSAKKAVAAPQPASSKPAPPSKPAGAGRPQLRWNQSLSVGISSIDDQHKTLVNLINELYSHMQSGSEKEATAATLDQLIQYTANHFKYEEENFDRHNYPDTKQHKEIHKKLVARVLQFQEEFNQGKADVSVELMDFLKDWLINHIKKVDKQYGPYLQSKGMV